jgi:hypothetical protein
MLRNKSNIKISELQTSYTPDGVDSHIVLSSIKALKLTESFSAFKNIKERGYGIKDVLAVLILMVVYSEKTVNSDKPRYLIFDDSTIRKSGKKMEFIGRVWDHVTQKYVLGFKGL